MVSPIFDVQCDENFTGLEIWREFSPGKISTYQFLPGTATITCMKINVLRVFMYANILLLLCFMICTSESSSRALSCSKR